jgi:hypothetical protein
MKILETIIGAILFGVPSLILLVFVAVAILSGMAGVG